MVSEQANQAVMTKLAKQARDDGKTKSLLLDTEIFNVPSMSLLNDCFILQTIPATSTASAERQAAADRLMATIKEYSENGPYCQTCPLFMYFVEMAPFYIYLTQQDYTGWTLDPSLYDQWQAEHADKLKALDEKLEDAKQNLGASDVFEILTEKALYLGKILDKVSRFCFHPIFFCSLLHLC